MVTGFYAGLLGLWLAFLLLAVVRLRFKYRVGAGDGGQRELAQAIRAHGNFVETVPFILILMLLLEGRDYGAPLWLHAAGILLVLSRVLHWYGMMKSQGTSKGRLVGTLLVLALFIGLSLWLVFDFIL